MENLSKKQKMVLIIIASFMLLVIGYYFMQKTRQYDNYEMSEMIQNNENKDSALKQNEEKLIIVHITGAVVEEGVMYIPKDSRIIDVINKAGGTKIDADLSKVNLAYMVSDGQKIYIPSIYDEDEEPTIVNDNSGENIIIDGDILKSNGMVNINRANQTELETLTGIRAIYCFKNS